MKTRSRVDARARLLRRLAGSGPLSRAELARLTSLAPSTVSAIVGELEGDGLVVELDPAPHGERVVGGRPAVRVALHRRAGLAVGIDFDKQGLRVGVADLGHTVLAEVQRPLTEDHAAAHSIPVAIEALDAALAQIGATRSEIVGVGLGLPGPVHRPTGALGDSTILPGWAGVRPAATMEAALGVAVDVENDATLGALGEWMWGAGRGASEMTYLKVATGVGAGFIVGGQPFVGAGGTAGEIGHTVIYPGGSICRCGNRGCLETVAGAAGVLHALSAIHGDDLTLADVVARAAAGDNGCRRAIADAGTAIGMAVATLCNLLNPARIVVGGELGAAGELLLAPLRDSLRDGAIRSAADDVTIVEAELGERAEVLGAIGLALRRGGERLAGGAAPA